MFKKLFSTQRYALIAFGLTVVYWSIVSLPYMSFSISKYIGFDPLTLIGSGGVLGPRKIHLLNYIEGSIIIILLSILLLTLRNPDAVIRFIILCAVIPLILISNVWVDMSPLGDFSHRIHITRLPSVEYDLIFKKATLKPQKINTFDDFYQAVEKNYQQNSATLSQRWKIKDDNYLRSLFYLNTVSHLFSYGNAGDPNKPGCAAANEQSNFENRPGKKLGIKFFLDSEIGCCTDYAYTLKYLLDRAGIESRLILLRVHGHWFNEVKIANRWHAIDGNIGVFYQKSWAKIVEGSEPFQALQFPTLSDDVTQVTYRPLFGTFRSKQLMVAASGAEKATYLDSLPDWIK